MRRDEQDDCFESDKDRQPPGKIVVEDVNHGRLLACDFPPPRFPSRVKACAVRAQKMSASKIKANDEQPTIERDPPQASCFVAKQ
jgi:hypothetical protein